MTLSALCSLLLALGLDRLLGEPRRFHPLVGLGSLVQKIEQRLNNPQHNFRTQRRYGVLALLLVLLPVLGLAGLVTTWLSGSGTGTLLFGALVLYLVIGGQSLKQHAQAVKSALQERNLALARTHVGYIVSRQTAQLDEQGVAKATIESILENGSDALFAPIFWFVVAGPIGAIAYRVINTLDAMWGYRNERFVAFGWAAARLDDLVNWIPARLCALSYALVVGNQRRQQALQAWRQQAPLCDSPNAGPVMTAGAGALNLKLGGSAVYHGREVSKPVLGLGFAPVAGDIDSALSLVQRTLFLWVAVLVMLALLTGVFAL